ncbi:MAG: hypothetical protein CO094_05345 [Anaerolineae bacterium CG_4_9_14_3_um_filter_57_17]|nr:DUF86 domain-containing protein [bacterium]NCT20409.1 DUF86 domain-containing protein [bacterium]OIO87372.1 MAG: hypothetical protein AUK01_00665 [Anaerolineae bacterium CG2_30_57_67]PJB66967.1 MAG: hypothetical protein CO094_05345 [Anaerolineae bacterium CG_4_9_14_3_um_filter_57_17]
MVRVEVLQKRIQKIDEYLQLLQKYPTISLEDFLSEPEHYNSAERLLQLAIEATIDMGNHLVADMNLGHADYGTQIPDILADKELISRELADIWVKMIGLRNILVHDYLDISHQIVYEIVQNRLEDITTLRDFFARYL